MSIADSLEWISHDPLQVLNQAKMRRLEAGDTLLDLSMINPDIEPPRYLIDRLVEASLKPSNHRYAVSRGIRKLRAAIAHKYEQRFEVPLDAEDEICAVMGTKDALIHTIAAQLRAGDCVLMGAPTYPLYLSSVRLSNASSCFFAVVPDEDAMLRDIGRQLIDNDVRMIVLNFPNNPTGISVSESFYQGLAAMLRGRNTIVFNDFVYGEMSYDGDAACSLLRVSELRERAVECYSMSKAYSIPGWRVGGIVGNSALIKRLSRLKSHLDYGLPLPIQHAAAAGLTSDHDLIEGTRQRYEARARTLVSGLNRLGWEVTLPGGGVSVWARIPEHLRASGSLVFTQGLLEKFGILLAPGFVYGSEFDSFVRFALVVSHERIIDVINCLEEFCAINVSEGTGQMLANSREPMERVGSIGKLG